MPRLKTKGQSRCWEASRVGEEAKQREEKHSDFCTGSPARLLPGPDKRVAVPRARPRSWPRNQALGPPISLAQPSPLSLGLLQRGVRLAVQQGCKEQGPGEDPARKTGLQKHTQYRAGDRPGTRTELSTGPHQNQM